MIEVDQMRSFCHDTQSNAAGLAYCFYGFRSKMPALFVGHGSPMKALEDNEFSRAWKEVGKAALPTPNAILCISAHWETSGAQVTGMEQPKRSMTLADFRSNFMRWNIPRPVHPSWRSSPRKPSRKCRYRLIRPGGLDHGTWSVLCRMFPDARIPVMQLRFDHTQALEFHYALRQELHALRDKSVLMIGSGNVVHNLRCAVFQEGAYDWAIEFDETIKQLVLSGDHDPIVHYQTLGQAARLSIPTNEQLSAIALHSGPARAE